MGTSSTNCSAFASESRLFIYLFVLHQPNIWLVYKGEQERGGGNKNQNDVIVLSVT